MEINQVSFRYEKNGRKILKKISFDIPEGKVTTILGPNGCGKSTLFQLMTKNLKPEHGSIRLDGEDISAIKLKDFARKVAIVHQYNTASPDLLVKSLVAYGRTPYRKMCRPMSKEDENKINWAMEVTGITDFKDSQIANLSGGQKQRVFIAMALAQGTKYLFLDEPTTYLDIRYQEEILQLVQTLNREYHLTVVMVLHDMNQAMHYSDSIIALKDGEVMVKGKPEDVITEDAIEEIYGIRLKTTWIEDRKYVLI